MGEREREKEREGEREREINREKEKKRKKERKKKRNHASLVSPVVASRPPLSKTPVSVASATPCMLDLAP